MDLQLQDQVAFIAGSSRGIGRAIAMALLEEGARVVLTGRDAASLRSTSEELRSNAAADRLLAISGDLTVAAVVSDAIDRAVDVFGRIDHLVANLGSGSGSAGWDQADEEWQRLFEHNFFASVRLTRAVLPVLLAGGGGSILYVSSITGVEATSAPPAYSAAKAALINYAKNLSRQLGSRGVRVNTIAPGNVVFAGGAWARRVDGDPSAVQKMLSDEVPQRRLGTPEEIASLAAYLCSGRASFCTGACYVIDGGQTRSL
jgi:3-oxoacyl-[acyl-carrier protein] reductase